MVAGEDGAVRVANDPWDDPSAEPFIRIEGLSKWFGDVKAVNDVDLDIYQGELFAILGSSGCGKSTLLRMLAGFEVPTSGRMIIDGVEMTDVPPYQRPVNMMFQSYAVFPHMTVEKNIAYGLKKEGLAKGEVSERVAEMLELVQLSELAKRKPDQLSGGQLQRVALARALVKRPKVLLLDEPLAALDKRLREQTQFELMNIQDQLGVTFVVVTHDQEEAMTLATRIAVMDEGEFVQIGTPAEVYEFPKNRFVADFFGTINMFAGTVTEVRGAHVLIESAEAGTIIRATLRSESIDSGIKVGSKVHAAVRPEKIVLSKSPHSDDERTQLKGTVLDLAYYGNLSVYRVKTDSDAVVQVSTQNVERRAQRTVEWDDEVYLSWDPTSSIVLKN